MSSNFISEVERANMECSVTSALRIARALGVHICDLLRDVGGRDPLVED